MSEITLVTGGARSGKSSYAEKTAKKRQKVLYLATARVWDNEMEYRVKKHKESRPHSWHTIEEPIKVDKVIQENSEDYELILFDCLTLWVTNLILEKMKDTENIAEKEIEESVLKEIDSLLKALAKTTSEIVIVTNEVGMGIVPENFLGRIFRDLAGKANQRMAREAKDVYFLVSGIPLQIKKSYQEIGV